MMKKTVTIIMSFLLLLNTGILLNGDTLPGNINKLLKTRTLALYSEALKIRRYLHQIPEPCLKESKTSKYIAEYLRNLGLEVQTGIAGTGIKAILRGNRSHPVVGIRSDMDALPITEKTGLPFKSTHNGYMHACGHDAHMTNVLIAAKILSEIKEKIPGTIVFVFQPCEEGTTDGTPSGAVRMVKKGVLKNPDIDAMFGLHVMPGKVGSIALCEGPFMANVSSVYITIKGKASHGAFPNQGIDAIYAASSAIMQFQSLISRRKDPDEKAVLSIGKINGGVRLNVIAGEVKMEGTVRSFSFETENMIEKGIEDILKGLKISLGITYDYKFHHSSRFVKNDISLTRIMLPLFNKLLGKTNVNIINPITAGEDFSVYSHKIPSLFFFLSVGKNRNLHTPTFFVEEESFKYGPALLSSAALKYLSYKVQSQ